MSVPVYDFNIVPSADWRSFDFETGKGKSVLLRIKKAATWEVVVDELVNLCDEVAARQAARRGDAFFNCPLARRYVDDRLCLDDPLHGYMIREKDTGALQGFIVYTVFTMWVAKDRFRWKDPTKNNINTARLPLAEGRKFCGKVFKKRFGAKEYQGEVKSYSIGKSYCGGKIGLWHVDYEDGDEEDLEYHEMQAHGLIPKDVGLPLVKSITSTINTWFKSVTPSNAAELVAGLQQQRGNCYGDALDTGVIWPRVVEITLLGALRCGGWLLELALEELTNGRMKGQFDYVVLSATKGVGE
jgi:hypothetical protein